MPLRENEAGSSSYVLSLERCNASYVVELKMVLHLASARGMIL